MIKIFPDIDLLNFFAAEKFVEIAKDSIKTRGEFSVALAGGSTPKSLYQLLSSEKFKDKIDWTQVFFFFGDERNVLPTDNESNFRMANENLFSPLQISETNIFRWQTEIENAQKIAEKYEKTLTNFFNTGLPKFDLILLGMGNDGHTASLFPFSEALEEGTKNATANWIENLKSFRLTLTFSVINSSRNVIFLVKGTDKSKTLQTILQGKIAPERFPAQSVKPTDGKLFWLIDEQAAALLDR